MLLNEFLDKVEQEHIIATLLKYYKVKPRIIYKSIDDYAHYNVDRNRIEISSKHKKIHNKKQFIITMIHEINHALDAKKYGRNKYKSEYEIEGEIAQQKGGDFHDDNYFEVKAEKWARKEYQKWQNKFK